MIKLRMEKGTAPSCCYTFLISRSRVICEAVENHRTASTASTVRRVEIRVVVP